MPTVGYVEKTIFAREGIDVDFMQGGKNVYSQVKLPYNYKTGRRTNNSANVTDFKERLKKQFPGYDFKVNDNDGNEVHGNTLIGNLRDTYDE